MRNRLRLGVVWLVALVATAISAGCERQPSTQSSSPSSKTYSEKAAFGPESSAVQPVLDQGWCAGHGVPESVCTRCNDSLIPEFKKAADWCGEHGLPESQCVKCHPEIAAKWAALKPADQTREHGTTQPGADPSPDMEHAALPKQRIGPDTSPINPVLDKGWCRGHGVPESVCTRCNASLIPNFKEAGDWCPEHGLPETQCTQCHPEVALRWAALDPDKRSDDEKSAGSSEADSEGRASEPVHADKWCFDHGVPKAVCTRCDATLIAKFKKAHDWCGEHGVPESQCVQCNPEVRAKWEALRPRMPHDDGSGNSSSIRIERNGQEYVFGENDPLCQIENSRIRFRDSSILRQAGIEVTAVRPRRMSASIEVPAEVEFDATRVTRITPRVAGVVREVRASLGDTLQEGEVLAVLDSSVLGEAKSLYIERQQDLRVAEAEHERVETIYEGTQRLLAAATATSAGVQEDLNGVPVGDAKAKLLRAHAALHLARANAAREAQLSEQEINAQRDVEAANAALAAAEAEFVATREEIAFTVQRERLAAERALQIARSALDAADRKLHILGLTHEEIAAIWTEGDVSLSHFELRSPVAGRVIERNVTAGESVKDDQTLFVITDTSSLWLIAGVYERDLWALREGLPIHFTVDGLPGGGFAGRLSWISSQVDDRTRLVSVRGELPNPEGLIRARMFGRSRIILRENEDVLSVPIEAVQTDGCCQLTFVRETDDSFVPRKVRLGASAGGYVEVLKGLREGEIVASAGSFLMKTEILKGSIGAGCCEVETGR